MEYDGRILVVEDDPFWQDLIRETLEVEYQVIDAATYDEASNVLVKIQNSL